MNPQPSGAEPHRVEDGRESKLRRIGYVRVGLLTERETGFEAATSSLGKCHTAESRMVKKLMRPFGSST